MRRERGITPAKCPRCGAEVPSVDRPDGSRAATACDCTGAEKASVEQQAVVNREHGLVHDDHNPDEPSDEETIDE